MERAALTAQRRSLGGVEGSLRPSGPLCPGEVAPPERHHGGFERCSPCDRQHGHAAAAWKDSAGTRTNVVDGRGPGEPVRRVEQGALACLRRAAGNRGPAEQSTTPPALARSFPNDR